LLWCTPSICSKPRFQTCSKCPISFFIAHVVDNTFALLRNSLLLRFEHLKLYHAFMLFFDSLDPILLDIAVFMLPFVSRIWQPTKPKSFTKCGTCCQTKVIYQMWHLSPNQIDWFSKKLIVVRFDCDLHFGELPLLSYPTFHQTQGVNGIVKG
jgi:hypothetical protein